ncbi:MAG: GGDEF domain-containing protein [Dehalococcoidia bacterium]
MSRLTRPHLWLGFFTAGIALAVVTALLLAIAAGPGRGLEALATAALGTAAAAGWWRAHRAGVRARRLEQTLAQVRQTAAGTALHDPLTNLGNHRLFDTSVRAAFARAQRYGQTFSLLLVEIVVPDPLRDGPRPTGYERVWKYIGTVVTANLRVADCAARLSDSMLGVILYETDYEGAMLAWDRLRHAARNSWPESRSWSISGGAATYSVETTSIESLLSDADRRLALEKRRLRTEPES